MQQLLLLLHRALRPGPGAEPGPQAVLAEVRQLVEAGYKDITLLGQNVNSYGNDLDLDYHFPDLLADIDRIPGEYLIRFMSSTPRTPRPGCLT